MAQSFLLVALNYNTTKSGLHGVVLRGLRRSREEQRKGEADLDFLGTLAAQIGHECSRGAQLMKSKSFHPTHFRMQVSAGLEQREEDGNVCGLWLLLGSTKRTVASHES